MQLPGPSQLKPADLKVPDGPPPSSGAELIRLNDTLALAVAVSQPFPFETTDLAKDGALADLLWPPFPPGSDAELFR